ncbi:hypothetical protein ACFFMN_25415 [Planobispora siamensis]|nr:hypothetical protein [Planobispora siamensis]
MTFTGEDREPRLRGEVAAIAGGWTALVVAGAAWSWFAQDQESRTPYWSAVAVVVTAAVVILVVLMVVHNTLARRGGAGTPVRGGLPGMILAVAAWLLGGMAALVHSIARNDARRGTGTACSFDALNAPAPGLESLSTVLAVSATVVLLVLLSVGRRSRVTAWLSPALVLGLYLLAMHMAEPHGTATACYG